jgi:CHAT domain-containing protein
VQGDLQRARACFERGLAIYDEIRKDIATSEREHEGLFTIYRHISELLIWLSIGEDRILETLQIMQQAKARYWSSRLKRLSKRESDDSASAIDEENLRNIIGLNGVLIEFFVGANALFVFLAYNRWFQVYRVDVAEDELSSMVDELRRRLQAGLRGTELAARLSHVLFDNARFDWKTLRLLLIAPDGPLWRIPIDVLPAPMSSGSSQAIGALAPVAFIPSASLIRQMHQWQESAAAPVFVAILYDGSSIAPSLAGAQQELDSIRAILSTRVTHVILGGSSGIQATPANVAGHLPTGTYIHIAAHAFADEHGDEAHILLTKGNGQDERLTASQIEALQLSARIVVLAACHSSFGRSSAGEGMVSLARSFLLAGARCVVASLWELNDLQSARFCSYLYTHLLEEASPAHAFRRAKDSYAQTFGRDETWAGLTIIGDADSWEDRFSPRYVELPGPITADDAAE